MDQEEVNLIEKIKHSFKDFAKVEVWITTWANDYFTVSNDVVNEYSLNDYAKTSYMKKHTS